MQHAENKIAKWPNSSGFETSCIGRIVDISPNGIARVDFPGNCNGPIPARSVVSAPPADCPVGYVDAKVLLTFENQDPSLPVIVGFVRDTLFPSATEIATVEMSGRDQVVVMDGSAVRLDAQEEMILSCGQSAIILRKDGRVVVKGVEITNRATRINKIKGGRVQIN